MCCIFDWPDTQVVICGYHIQSSLVRNLLSVSFTILEPVVFKQHMPKQSLNQVSSAKFKVTTKSGMKRCFHEKNHIQWIFGGSVYMPCRITHQVDERNMVRPEHANSHLLLLSIILESNFYSIFQNPHSPIGLLNILI